MTLGVGLRDEWCNTNKSGVINTVTNEYLEYMPDSGVVASRERLQCIIGSGVYHAAFHKEGVSNGDVHAVK